MSDIPSKDLFMMCEELNKDAFSELLPDGYYFRSLRTDEFEKWKDLQCIDNMEHRAAYHKVLDEYYKNAYEPEGDLFFNKCVVVCDKDDKFAGACVIWKSYGKFNTLGWFKVGEAYEGRGIGRALTTHVMKNLAESDYPVFLHTHPSSYRAIKLYSDFGFRLITDKKVGKRNNDLDECMPILKQYIPEKDFANLKTVAAPQFFLDAADSTDESF
ncbi:MAG: GNAT family N-acetyltransferase [Alphaproteobacteria bacterium]|nr:GNAT family N-acetyltransferase [Alphaproteobacteria bacterium]MCL2757716.1 GNAT family N-acetyltransferase [Alphaproteobacteria bacterium]